MFFMDYAAISLYGFATCIAQYAYSFPAEFKTFLSPQEGSSGLHTGVRPAVASHIPLGGGRREIATYACWDHS